MDINSYSLRISHIKPQQLTIEFFKNEPISPIYKQKVSFHELNRISKNIKDSYKNLLEKVGSIEDLIKNGQNLFSIIFPNELKRRINSISREHLRVCIDDSLVQIPWELIHDGRNFFCLKFHMGRIVSTGARIPDYSLGEKDSILKILIIADPRGDLPEAYNEGIQLQEMLKELLKQDSVRTDIKIDIITSQVSRNDVINHIRDYDLIHYTGHAEYSFDDPSLSGWLLCDGKLEARKIKSMSGLSMPLVVFANGCETAFSREWEPDPKDEGKVFGIANAFLFAGVKHYIGTLWNIPDAESSLLFAETFYRYLFKGVTIGQAITQARKRIKESNQITWVGYSLYGDPICSLIKALIREQEPKLPVNQISFVIVFNAPLNDITSYINGITESLKKISGDPYLRTVRIENGSVKVYFECTKEGFEKLFSLKKKRELNEILGFKVHELSIVSEEKDYNDLIKNVLEVVIQFINDQLEFISHTGSIFHPVSLLGVEANSNQDEKNKCSSLISGKSSKALPMLVKYFDGYRVEINIQGRKENLIDIQIRVKESKECTLIPQITFTLIDKKNSKHKAELTKDGIINFERLKPSEYSIKIIKSGNLIGTITLELKEIK